MLDPQLVFPVEDIFKINYFHKYHSWGRVSTFDIRLRFECRMLRRDPNNVLIDVDFIGQQQGRKKFLVHAQLSFDVKKRIATPGID